MGFFYLKALLLSSELLYYIDHKLIEVLTLTRFQRGATLAFIIAIVGGLSLLFTTIFSEASVSSPYGANERQSKMKEEGYRVVYTKESGEELSTFHFSACENVSEFSLVDKNWREASSSDFDKIVCK